VIEVHVNGERWLMPPEACVADVVTRLVSEPRGIAVALDGSVITRTDWVRTALHPGARVEVLTAVQGG
jgi:sulfur carrier protein